VLGKADAIVTVNSKSGAEALLLGKPVLVLGDAFYRSSPLATRVDALAVFPAALAAALDRTGAPERGAIEGFFQSVWDASYPGELYDVSDANVATFSASLAAALAR
jgi:hypothetical protein